MLRVRARPPDPSVVQHVSNNAPVPRRRVTAARARPGFSFGHLNIQLYSYSGQHTNFFNETVAIGWLRHSDLG